MAGVDVDVEDQITARQQLDMMSNAMDACVLTVEESKRMIEN